VLFVAMQYGIRLILEKIGRKKAEALEGEQQ